jgi:hypothetical protein
MIGADEVREPGTYQAAGWLQVSRAELTARGVSLVTPIDDGTWDEAGPIQEALIELDTGEQALIIWHLALEDQGRSALDLRAPISTTDPTAFASAVVGALQLPDERCEWVVPIEEWRDLQRHAAEWRAWRAGERHEPPTFPPG